MPFTPDMNSTAQGYQGYQDPNLVNQTYGYAGELTKGGLRDKEITSPWQGVRMMADALSGGMMRNRAGQMGQGNRNLDASGVMGAAQPPGGPAPQSPLSVNPPPSQPSSSPGSFGTPTPPVPKPAPIMSPAPPIAGLGGSVPNAMPGGVPHAPVDPMQALMMQPPGQGMA